VSEDAKAEILAALWRLSREEAEDLRARIALLERAVMRAMGGATPAGEMAAWREALAAEERAAEAGRARSARIAALLQGHAA
jgi:hypothetical protein